LIPLGHETILGRGASAPFAGHNKLRIATAFAVAMLALGAPERVSADPLWCRAFWGCRPSRPVTRRMRGATSRSAPGAPMALQTRTLTKAAGDDTVQRSRCRRYRARPDHRVPVPGWQAACPDQPIQQRRVVLFRLRQVRPAAGTHIVQGLGVGTPGYPERLIDLFLAVVAAADTSRSPSAAGTRLHAPELPFIQRSATRASQAPSSLTAGTGGSPCLNPNSSKS
jgi:hypothetical protein